MLRHRVAQRHRGDSGANSPSSTTSSAKRIYVASELDSWDQLIERWTMLARPRPRADAQEAEVYMNFS